jgi:hypothetical protein
MPTKLTWRRAPSICRWVLERDWNVRPTDPKIGPQLGARQQALAVAGATATGMLPPGVVPEGQEFPEPALTGPPIVWLASDKAGGETG